MAKPNGRVVTFLILLLATHRAFSSAATVSISYDKFRDISSAQLEKIMLATGDPEITMVTAFDFNGQRLTASTKVRPYLFIESHSRVWLFTRYREVTLLVDGERMHIKPVDYSSHVIDSHDLSENMVVPLTKAQLMRLARARKIEGQIGVLTVAEFTLSPENIEGLRKLAACLDPAAFRKLAESK
jgi:hypothetical protein